MLSQVDEEAFKALEECIASGNFDVCEAVPAGNEEGFLANPIAAFAVDMAGPARYGTKQRKSLFGGGSLGDIHTLT